MLLAPPSAVRAHDVLSRHLLENFHPLALAEVLCAPETCQAFARQVLLDLRYPAFPVWPTNEAGPSSTEQWSRAVWLEAVENFVRRAGWKPEALVAPPRPLEPGNRSYCPRCGAQFIARKGTCADCGGRPLLPFAASHQCGPTVVEKIAKP
jgi:hypothetical protein